MADHVDCPDCGAVLQYLINYDVYACTQCKARFTVLSVERSHKMYTGGPPERADG